MARRNPPNRVNNIPYMFYLSEEQMKFIREQSKKEGKSQAEYCRGLVTDAMARVEFYQFAGQNLAKAVTDDSADALAYAVEYRAKFPSNPLANQSETMVKSVTRGQICDTMKTGEE